MNEDDKLKRGPRRIICPTCSQIAINQGTQDRCDVYVCENNHLTRIRIDKRNELAGPITEST